MQQCSGAEVVSVASCSFSTAGGLLGITGHCCGAIWTNLTSLVQVLVNPCKWIWPEKGVCIWHALSRSRSTHICPSPLHSTFSPFVLLHPIPSPVLGLPATAILLTSTGVSTPAYPLLHWVLVMLQSALPLLCGSLHWWNTLSASATAR